MSKGGESLGSPHDAAVRPHDGQPCSHRTLIEVETALAAAKGVIADLNAAKDALIEDRTKAILRDFDEGVSRATLCKIHGVTYAALSAILFKTKRTKRSQLARGLNSTQAADYIRLTRQGVSPLIARKIALNAGTSTWRGGPNQGESHVGDQ